MLDYLANNAESLNSVDFVFAISDFGGVADSAVLRALKGSPFRKDTLKWKSNIFFDHKRLTA